MTLGLINANPVVHAKKERIARSEDFHGDDAVDPLEIYDILFLTVCVFTKFWVLLSFYLNFNFRCGFLLNSDYQVN